MNQLYHYVHCPFCVRVRLASGFLNIKYESIVLPYNDEKTPLDLMGVKMLPIMTFSDGAISNESLDIIKILDNNNLLENDLLECDLFNEIEVLLDEIGKPVHNLCMPYWIFTPEFDEESRAYFLKKKEAKRGPFHLLAQKKANYLAVLPNVFEKLKGHLKPFYKSDNLTILDIMIASHLWGLYVLPEFQFPDWLHDYLQSIGKACQFDYHKDFWRKKI